MDADQLQYGHVLAAQVCRNIVLPSRGVIALCLMESNRPLIACYVARTPRHIIAGNCESKFYQPWKTAWKLTLCIRIDLMLVDRRGRLSNEHHVAPDHFGSVDS